MAPSWALSSVASSSKISGPTGVKALLRAICTTAHDYIWIDSLCILQDLTEDWQIESANMAHYYAGAYLTISAAYSSDTGSFLRRSERYRPSSWSIVENGVQKEFRAQIDPEREVTREGMRGYGQLNARGWAFQETVLPPRVLMYTTTGMVWMCRDNIVREEGDTAPLTPYHHLNRIVQEDPWAHYVTLYSDRDLTYDRDKLPAMAGLARAFAERTGYTYAAGLWEESLVPGLTWRGNTYHTDETRLLEDYVAPSWSWASIFRGVYYPEVERRVDLDTEKDRSLKLINCDVTISGLNPYGEVTSGRLEVAAYIVPVKIRNDICFKL